MVPAVNASQAKREAPFCAVDPEDYKVGENLSALQKPSRHPAAAAPPQQPRLGGTDIHEKPNISHAQNLALDNGTLL